MRIKYVQSGNLFAIKQYTVSTLVWYGMNDEMNVSANVNACVNTYTNANANMNAAHVPLQGSGAVNEHAYKSDEFILCYTYTKVFYFFACAK